MKILVALIASAALMACGGKAKKSTTPDNKTGTSDTTKTEGTGGTTYGGAKPPAPTNGQDPCAGQ